MEVDELAEMIRCHVEKLITSQLPEILRRHAGGLGEAVFAATFTGSKGGPLGCILPQDAEYWEYVKAALGRGSDLSELPGGLRLLDCNIAAQYLAKGWAYPFSLNGIAVLAQVFFSLLSPEGGIVKVLGSLPLALGVIQEFNLTESKIRDEEWGESDTDWFTRAQRVALDCLKVAGDSFELTALTEPDLVEIGLACEASPFEYVFLGYEGEGARMTVRFAATGVGEDLADLMIVSSLGRKKETLRNLARAIPDLVISWS